MLLGFIEQESNHLPEAMTALRKAQSVPSLFPGACEAARLWEGITETKIWMATNDASCMKRAAAALRDSYKTTLPLGDMIHNLAVDVGVRAGDFFLSRQAAEAMPKDSASQLAALVRIEYFDGNREKALMIAEKAVGLFPKDANLQSIAEQAKTGSLIVDPDAPLFRNRPK